MIKKYIKVLFFLSVLILGACADSDKNSNITAKLFFMPDNAVPYQASSSDFVVHEAQFLDMRNQSFSPTVQKNGFSFADFRGGAHEEFLTTLRKVKLSLERNEQDRQLLNQFNGMAEKTMNAWAKTHLPSLQFDKTICTFTIYRSSKPVGQAHSNFPIAHVDFAKGYFAHSLELLKALEREALFSQRLGIETNDVAYWNDPKRLALLLNVWLPLNEVVKNHHLGVMDITSVDSQNDETAFFTSIPDQEDGQKRRQFFSVGLKYRPQHKWYFKSGMEFGEAVIFDTKNTPHASISPIDPDFERRSIETRCFFTRQ